MEESDQFDQYRNLDANKVLSAFGKYGRYQMRTYVISCFAFLLTALSIMIIPFVTETPNFECHFDQPNGTHWEYTKINECEFMDANNWTISCLDIPGAHFKYEESSSSLAAQFDLVCKDADEVAHASSMYLLGGVIVVPFIMQFSDWYGRRPVVLIPFVISLFAQFICIFAPTYKIFLAGRFILGLSHISISSISLPLSMESVSTEFRSLIPVCVNIFWITGYLMAGVLKLYISNWRWLLFATAVPGIFLILIYPLLPESLHWLLTKKKFKEAKELIEKMSKFNGVEIDLDSCQALEITPSETSNRSVVDILKSPVLFFSLLVNGYLFIITNLTYFFISLSSTHLSEDKMTGFFLSGLIDVPGALLSTLMINFCKRKFTSVVTLLAQSVSMLLILYIPFGSTSSLIFSLLVKCFCVVTTTNQPLHCSEATPTSVRSAFMGTTGFLRDIGGFLAPYLGLLANWDKRAPTVLISILCLVGGLTVFSLPETRNRELPEDIGDVDPGPLMGLCFPRNKEEDEETLIQEDDVY